MKVDHDAATPQAPTVNCLSRPPRRTLVAWLIAVLDAPVRRHVATPLLVLVWVLATLGSFVVREVLPERFYLDGHFIESVAVGSPFGEPDRVFATTGWLYWALGLTLDPLLPSVFGMLVAGALVASSYASRQRTVPVSGVLLSAGALVLFTVFFAWYTKETFAAVAITATVLLLRSQAHRLWAIAPILGYGMFLRTYWLLVVGIYVGLLVVERMRPLRWWRLALWAAGALVAATLGYAVALGGSLQGIRASVNELRDIGDAASMISPLVAPGNLVVDAVSAVVILVTLILPAPLVLTGQAMHLVYGAAIFGLWLVPFLSAFSLRRAPAPDDTPVQVQARRTALSSLYLLVAFVTVFAVFEPDYGSYLRHLSSLVPVMVVLVVAQRRAQAPLR